SIITSIEKSNPSTSATSDSLFPGLKRPVSSLSPPLFAFDTSQQIKSKRISQSPPADPKPALPARMISSPTDMIDFGVAALPPASSEGDLNIASFVLEVRNRLSRLESAHAEISRLRAALAESESACQALEAQLSRLSAPPASSSSAAAPPPPPQPSKAVSFASVAAASSVPSVPAPPRSSVSVSSVSAAPTSTTSSNGKKRKKKSAAPPPPSIKKATATVSRLFGPQSDIPSGYQFVYMSIARRRPLQEIRRTLQGINLNNSRVLDIQYPVPNVISFLVHHDYVYTFTSTMHLKGRGCSPLLDFDPCDPKNLLDPKFDSLSPSLRAEKAVEIENLRCLRALSFVRRSVRLSVARSFLFYDKITQKQFDAILAEELSFRAAAAPPAPSATVAQDRLAKKQRLSYLSNLLYFDSATAKSLAYTESPALSPSSAADTEMPELSGV
ncbi:unnamed protein product, partial [Mucor circinelloides]